MHPPVQASGFRVQGSGFRVQGSGFRVQGSGFKIQGSGSGVEGYLRLIDSCITQLKAQGPSRTCNESKEEEEGFSGKGWGFRA